ncbi:hypothetical protein BCU70_11630 [Vibrio sp. 10N.286.49.C2]|uniref:DUF1107 family protein n=1 Tax=unclassified Vibrio TaxID=2614977 RepID=UPI000C834E52|nr:MULTISPECIES: DUF1107 family protein [unclassified Vibrio]PMH40185.1 hypothetical protein BCU70_11630 [Vibrio sp. 10N.286.49.C2]PMH46362.1 hypothetical protein BCU66_01460 [Vibrio sp. 10N.286.49.B1]PMH79158.1 hypothetical protein BCU58_06285 [Vibrio sp. 10N.286.48.B7]
MLRKFTVYRPKQIAKFVKTLFKGQFFIAGLGLFMFDNGKVLLPGMEDRRKLDAFKEINGEIAALAL